MKELNELYAELKDCTDLAFAANKIWFAIITHSGTPEHLQKASGEIVKMLHQERSDKKREYLNRKIEKCFSIKKEDHGSEV
jgi:hypothetical protein